MDLLTYLLTYSLTVLVLWRFVKQTVKM